MLEAGDGKMAGLDNESNEVPRAPIVAERISPGLERSIRYHRAGLTSASVKETWSVDVQGSFLCAYVSITSSKATRGKTYNSKSNS